MVTGNSPNVSLRLSASEDRLAICRLEPDSEVPDWAVKGGFFSITRTVNELSIVCLEQSVPEGFTFEDGWRALGVEGPLDFSMTGVLASLLDPLAEAGISVFAVSTYDTDYVLVKEDQLDPAVDELGSYGHEIVKV